MLLCSSTPRMHRVLTSAFLQPRKKNPEILHCLLHCCVHDVIFVSAVPAYAAYIYVKGQARGRACAPSALMEHMCHDRCLSWPLLINDINDSSGDSNKFHGD